MFEQFKNILIRRGLEWFGRYYSIYRAEVVDNEDPKFLGRLKVKVPQIYGEDVPDYWAWSRGMFAGNQIGLFAIPTPGDAVWVSFENGDPRFPIWEYGWYKDGDVPDDAKVDGNKPKSIILQSKTKHRIELDDKNELIRVTDSHGNIIELNETGISIVTEKISLGTLDGSEEPAVLGDTLMELINEFRDDIGNLGTIVTSTGVTGLISTSPQWAALTDKWDNKFENFKSEKVTLD